MSDAYFFGCGHDVGHYFFESGLRPARRPVLSPWDDHEIDGAAQPGCFVNRWNRKDSGKQKLGPARLHRKDGWTMLSFWDRSVDKRENSNGNFIFKGDHDFDAMMKLAAKHFPEVLERLSVPLFLEPSE